MIQFGVEAPAAGYILILVTLGGDAMVPNSGGNFARFKVCVADTASGCDISSSDTWEWYWWGEHLKGNVGAIQKLYPVSTAGTYSYYVNAEGFGHDNENYLYAHLRANITALYLPTWYDTGDPPDNASVLTRPNDPQTHASVAVATAAIQPTDLDNGVIEQLRAEFSAKLKNMEEDFQRKLAELKNDR